MGLSGQKVRKGRDLVFLHFCFSQRALPLARKLRVLGDDPFGLSNIIQ